MTRTAHPADYCPIHDFYECPYYHAAVQTPTDMWQVRTETPTGGVELHHFATEAEAEEFAHRDEDTGPNIGDIYYTSWGYDQTNVEYFTISAISSTGKSAKLRPVGTEIRDGRVYPDPDRFVRDYWVGDETTWRRIKRRFEAREGRWAYSFKIDRTRWAWEYDGGGRFDTIAAGYPGH